MFEFSAKDLQRNIKLPKHSEVLAELFGILCGDGSLINRGRIHRVSISLNLTEDMHYSNYVNNLIKILFNIDSIMNYREDHRIEMLINSKTIVDFLLSEGLTSSPKDFKLKVPAWIAENNSFMTSFIRGLADTDGSLFFAKRGTYSKNEYPVIEIKLHNNKCFIESLSKYLKSIGFNVYQTDIKVQINGKRGLFLWRKSIGFSNLNQISRYLVWERFGYCPSKTTLSERIALLG